MTEPDADVLLKVLSRAIRDPARYTERRVGHQLPLGGQSMEILHHWQARAAMEAIRPFLRDAGTGMVISVLVRRLGGDVLVTDAELAAIDGELVWRQEPGGGLRIAHVPGDTPVTPEQVNDAVAEVLREVASNG